jgi:hypothetical protein
MGQEHHAVAASPLSLDVTQVSFRALKPASQMSTLGTLLNVTNGF